MLADLPGVMTLCVPSGLFTTSRETRKSYISAFITRLYPQRRGLCVQKTVPCGGRERLNERPKNECSAPSSTTSVRMRTSRTRPRFCSKKSWIESSARYPCAKRLPMYAFQSCRRSAPRCPLASLVLGSASRNLPSVCRRSIVLTGRTMQPALAALQFSAWCGDEEAANLRTPMAGRLRRRLGGRAGEEGGGDAELASARSWRELARWRNF